ncbi:hypothetical protein MP638_006156 [Amoeboaphelidium occidentale]|nr:hypothetical protein MP638_006156 [Amoeboaphelidium occidentale]
MLRSAFVTVLLFAFSVTSVVYNNKNINADVDYFQELIDLYGYEYDFGYSYAHQLALKYQNVEKITRDRFPMTYVDSSVEPEFQAIYQSSLVTVDYELVPIYRVAKDGDVIKVYGFPSKWYEEDCPVLLVLDPEDSRRNPAKYKLGRTSDRIDYRKDGMAKLLPETKNGSNVLPFRATYWDGGKMEKISMIVNVEHEIGVYGFPAFMNLDVDDDKNPSLVHRFKLIRDGSPGEVGAATLPQHQKKTNKFAPKMDAIHEDSEEEDNQEDGIPVVCTAPSKKNLKKKKKKNAANAKSITVEDSEFPEDMIVQYSDTIFSLDYCDGLERFETVCKTLVNELNSISADIRKTDELFGGVERDLIVILSIDDKKLLSSIIGKYRSNPKHAIKSIDELFDRTKTFKMIAAEYIQAKGKGERSEAMENLFRKLDNHRYSLSIMKEFHLLFAEKSNGTPDFKKMFSLSPFGIKLLNRAPARMTEWVQHELSVKAAKNTGSTTSVFAHEANDYLLRTLGFFGNREEFSLKKHEHCSFHYTDEKAAFCDIFFEFLAESYEYMDRLRPVYKEVTKMTSLIQMVSEKAKDRSDKVLQDLKEKSRKFIRESESMLHVNRASFLVKDVNMVTQMYDNLKDQFGLSFSVPFGLSRAMIVIKWARKTHMFHHLVVRAESLDNLCESLKFNNKHIEYELPTDPDIEKIQLEMAAAIS